MALTIQTTGLEQYAAGGEGRLQVMIIGGPGAGKTRFSSFWPRPIYANCEAGLASIADRNVPFVTVKKSQDMLDLLQHLQLECRRPWRDRQYQTVVVDTIDAFQRVVKDEWLQANNAQSFRGFDAWGYLDAKMQMLLTRLLNLDMNVVVLAHYKDKTIKEGQGENASERQELMLQLSGEVKDSIFNDFDLVGWMGTYWEAVDGQRVEKRGLTFKRTPDKPFLKDRLNVTPTWMEVTFSEEDYGNLFVAVTSRLDEFKPSEQVGEIAPVGPEGSVPSGGVPAPVGSGPMPADQLDPAALPLVSYDKPTLQQMCRELGIPFKQNHLKGELVEFIEKKRAENAAGGETDSSSGSAPEAAAGTAEPEQPVDEPPAADAPATPVEPAPSDASSEPTPPAGATPGVEELAASAAATPVVKTEVGDVDPATGEIVAPMAPEEVAEALGGAVVSETETAEKPVVATAQEPEAPAQEEAPAPAEDNCEACGKPLAGENQNYVALGFIKFRKRLCNEHFLAARKGA